MSRLSFAFSCFWSVLFRGKLPNAAILYLPEGEAPPEPLPPPQSFAPAPPRPAPQPPLRGPETPEMRAEGALLLLGLLQREGRLVDFLTEGLDQHGDAAIGAAVRDIHRGCRKVLTEHLRLEPVMPGQEEGPVVVPRGFDPTEVRLIGRAAGEPPFRGILVHHGWRAVDVRLPSLSEGVDRRVVAPAEVRLP
jgi:uncharacterized protein DUF2760